MERHDLVPTSETLDMLRTPCLVLDSDRMDRNITRLRERLADMGVRLRPHLKSTKSIDIARRVMASSAGPATVSTLEELTRFADAGVNDLIYAVGIAPSKLEPIVALLKRGVDVAVILDTIEQADAVGAASRNSGTRIPALIEIDCDGHRSGVSPDDTSRLLAIGRSLEAASELRGVLAHAGRSYAASGPEALRRCAEIERASAVDAARALREVGLACPVVSVGSTPTAHSAVNLDGVTEVRAGVFVLFDLVQAGLGICQVDDIAISVLATVIGHQREKRWIIVDAGWMAMSGDRHTSEQALDQGYGLVCDYGGRPFSDLILSSVSQEHGIIEPRNGSTARLPELAIGDRVRILPNHACATGAQHDCYHVVNSGSDVVTRVWPRFGGW